MFALVHLALLACYIFILAAVAYTDIRSRRIPNRIMYPAIILALVGMFIFPGWQSALMGALCGALVFFIPVIFYGPNRAGMGDVKLALFIGLILGFPGIFYALLVSFAAALIVIIPGLLLRKLNRQSLIPFGPFLSFGAILVLVLVQFYLNDSGPTVGAG